MTTKAITEMVRMETYAKFPYLIEVTLASGTVYRYANCDEDVTFEDNVYTAGYFNITPPDIQESEIGDGTLTISSVDQTWINIIRSESSRAKIRFVGCIVYDDDNNIETVESIEDTEYILTSATWDDKTISWKMVFDENLTINIPCDVASSTRTNGVY